MWKVGLPLNEAAFSPHSADGVVLNIGGPISVVFLTPVFGVGGYFTYDSGPAIAIYDGRGALLGELSGAYAINLIDGSVNVQRLNAAGGGVSVLGMLHDDGLQSDAVAGGQVYTLRDSLLQALPGTLKFQVSADFKGEVKRVMAGPLALVVGSTAATPTIGTAQMAPGATPAGVGVIATLTALIDNGATVPTTVVLQKLDGNGAVLATFGNLHDDGSDASNNHLRGIPVTFSVTGGGGGFGTPRSPTLQGVSDSDGRVAATLIMGPDAGGDNNVVEVSFGDNPGYSAAFAATGMVPGPATLSRISGVVLDNSNQPIPGVTMRLLQIIQGNAGAHQPSGAIFDAAGAGRDLQADGRRSITT